MFLVARATNSVCVTQQSKRIQRRCFHWNLPSDNEELRVIKGSGLLAHTAVPFFSGFEFPIPRSGSGSILAVDARRQSCLLYIPTQCFFFLVFSKASIAGEGASKHKGNEKPALSTVLTFV